MAAQSAAFYPPHYTIWYEHVAGLNPPLSRALEERMAAGGKLTDADVAHLYAQHVLARDTTMFERLEERFRLLLDEVSQATATAGEDASRFGSSLEAHLLHLGRPSVHDSLHELVAELLADTRRMCVVTSELTKQLERSAAEIRVLTERLESAQREAIRDPLTGLYNRRGFARAVEEARRSFRGLERATLLVVDIDHFKRINDDYGHLLGDKVLRAVADVLRGKSSGEGIVARLGGEEFALLLPDVPLPAAAALAERIREAVARLRVKRMGQPSSSVGRITVSIGVAAVGDDATLEQVIAQADAALYAAKRGGRDGVRVAGASDTATTAKADPRTEAGD